MSKTVRLKGRLRIYLYTSLALGVVLALVNVGIYFMNVKAGVAVSVFVLVYLAIMAGLLLYSRPMIMNDLINFATQYGTIQKKLLRELELPYALLDDNGRVIWTNRAFEEAVHKEKGYKKSITTLFPELTRDKFPIETEEALHEIAFEDRFYAVRMKKISLREMIEYSNVISASEAENFLIAVYLFDETDLKIALKENDDQSLAVGMIYLDNYDEALESVEEVRRSLLTALIERKINKYVASVDGIVKRLEKD